VEVPGTSIADKLHAAMCSLLATHPTAFVAAAHIDGVFVPVPPSVPLSGHRFIEARSSVDIVVPDDRVAVIEAWKRAVATGGAREAVHLLGEPDALTSMHFLDVRGHHGVIMVIVLAGEKGIELLSRSEAPPERPKVCRTRMDPFGMTLEADEAASSMLGWSTEELVGRSGLDLVHPDDHTAAIDNWMEMVASGSDGRRIRFRHALPDGGWKWVEFVAHRRIDDPAHGDVLAEMTDIDDEMAALEALSSREQLLRRLAESLPTGLLQLRADRTVAYTNERLHDIVGCPAAATVEEQLATVDRDEWHLLDAALEAVLAGADAEAEVRLRHAGRDDVRLCQFSFRSLCDPDGTVGGAIVSVADVTESAQLRLELEDRATFDVLTRCHNRAAVLAALESTLWQHERHVAVVFIDLDGFKAVNDGLGHAAGDELLVTVADRLRDMTRGDDIVGRLGGDEFLVVCPSVDTLLETAEIGERVAAALRGEVFLAAGPVDLRASIGVVHAGPRSMAADELVARADAAMYESKRRAAGRPVVRHVGGGTDAELDDEGHLREAIERDHLSAHFQPIVDLATGDAIGFEALLRWRRGDRTLDAGEFIELADHSGLILEIGGRARDEVWGLAADARARTGRSDHLWFLNVSPVELATPGFAASIEHLLDVHDLPARAFVIEASAGPDLVDRPAAQRALRELHEIGVRTALDDFGPGASLELLRTLPVDVVKLAPSFTSNLTDRVTAQVVASLLELTGKLDLLAVVEGIEQAAHRDAAAMLGARYGQGHLFAAAAPLAELLPWLESGGDITVPGGSLRR
jgi:diguanylate cyclase (GGDEF)-like protein/PAS domain S-box-containing protein